MASPFPGQPPEPAKPSPYWPAMPSDVLMFEDFQGVNTATSRVGVDDKQAYWLDGFMPIGPKLLRTLFGVGTAIWTVPSGSLLAFFDFANIGTAPIMIAFLADGSIFQVSTNTMVATEIAPAGTIQNPARATTGMCQWGSQYVIIVSQQTDGYFIWDGTLLYSPGTLGPGVTITAGGTGYTSTPTLAASGGSGTGATFEVTVSGGIVVSVAITDPGSGYAAGDTVTLGFSGGGGSGATATIILMPFAIAGSAVETYSGRVWVANGPTISYSAPGSVSDFSSASGGGNFTSSDPFLRVNYIQLKQTNGFLYLIGDSSINYISGVQTSGTPPVTTFTNQNADPEVGTPWPATVTTFGRSILFANAFGAQVSYGSAVSKISEPLDGVYNTVPLFGGFVPSAAKAIVFGRKLWMLLLPIVDPVSRQQRIKLLIWDSKKWFASEQDIDLAYIQHQEINSVITAYGTDGTSVYPLFATPSVNFTKTAQSKLWTTPGGYQFVKTTVRLWGIVQYYSANSPEVTVHIDNEDETEDDNAAYSITAGPPELTWENSHGVLAWTNANGALAWARNGLAIFDPQSVGQVGILTGMTVTTDSDNLALVSLMMANTVEQLRA